MDDQSDEPFLPIFPSDYDSIKRTDFYVIIDGEVGTDEDLEQLFDIMHNNEEANFYLFSRRDSGISTYLLSAEKASRIKF